MEEKKQYMENLDGYKEEMVQSLQEIVAIPSVKSGALPNMPFGENTQRAFEYMLEKGKEFGFIVKNIDNYGGHIEVKGDSSEVMGILVHLDVVPEGTNWDYPPYGGVIEDGKLFGRGTLDNKAPAIAVLYALKSLKDSGVTFEKGVRIILGLDEETGWEGMDYYFKKEAMPDFGFVPDASFPLIYAEKGILVCQLVKKIAKNMAGATGVAIRSISGGNAPNMVADKCTVVVSGGDYGKIKELLAGYVQRTGHKLSAKGRGRSLEITAEGISAHGARPEEGLNAISIMFEFLSEINTINETMNEFIEFYNNHIAMQLSGEGLGCAMTDDVSGNLILNVGKIDGDDKAVSLTINIRYPVTKTSEEVYDAIAKVTNTYDIGIIKEEHKKPIHVPKDSDMVKTLLSIYREHTGDDTEPLTTGGGTYARAIENAVAFGMAFPWTAEVEHQKNEYIVIDDFIKASKIYADAIYQLAGGYILSEDCNEEERI